MTYPRVWHCSLLFPLQCPARQAELDQEKSSTEQEDTLHKGPSPDIEHDGVSNDEVRTTPLDGNAADDMSNTAIGPVNYSKSKGQNSTAQSCFHHVLGCKLVN